MCRKDIELSEETEFNLRFHSTVKLDQIARSVILTGGSGEKCVTLVELPWASILGDGGHVPPQFLEWGTNIQLSPPPPLFYMFNEILFLGYPKP